MHMHECIRVKAKEQAAEETWEMIPDQKEGTHAIDDCRFSIHNTYIYMSVWMLARQLRLLRSSHEIKPQQLAGQLTHHLPAFLFFLARASAADPFGRPRFFSPGIRTGSKFLVAGLPGSCKLPTKKAMLAMSSQREAFTTAYSIDAIRCFDRPFPFHDHNLMYQESLHGGQACDWVVWACCFLQNAYSNERLH